MYNTAKELYWCDATKFVFDVKKSLAKLFSEKCPQKALRSIIGTRSVVDTLVATEDGQRLIAFFKDEFDLDMNSDPLFISATQRQDGHYILNSKFPDFYRFFRPKSHLFPWLSRKLRMQKKK